MDWLKKAAHAIPTALSVLVALTLAVAALKTPTVPADALSAAVLPGSVISLTNGERVSEGIPALVRNSKLDTAAQLKAEDMAKKSYYAHVSPEGLTPMHFAQQAGYDYLMIGENLVVNRDNAQQVVSAFMGSAGHRANILRDDFTEIGVGVANGTYKDMPATFVVQMFGKPRAKTPTVILAQSDPKPATPAPATPKPVAKPVVVVPKIVKEVQKTVAPILKPLQATSTIASTTPPIATSSPSIQEILPPTFTVPPSIPVALDREVPIPPTTLTFRERLADNLGYIWERISRLWN